MSRHFYFIIFWLIIGFVATGCSGGSDPISPADANPEVRDISTGSASTNDYLLGYYTIDFDIDNLEAEVIPMRTALFECNIVKFLNADPASLSINIYDVVPGPGYIDLRINLAISHPMDNHNFDGYDVRGVLIGDGSGTLSYNTDLKYPVNGTDQILTNADGYTRWFNPTEFMSPGFMGYTPGILASPGYTGSSTLNGYMYHGTGIGYDQTLWDYFLTGETYVGSFPAASTHSRKYFIRLQTSPPGTKFNYAVVASWSNVDPTHATEAVGVEAVVSGDVYFVDPMTNGGTLELDIGVFDWGSALTGGVMLDYNVIIESSVLANPYTLNTSEMTPTSSGNNYNVYHVEIPSSNVTTADGNEVWIIIEYPGFDYTSIFGVPNSADTDSLAAIFRYPLYVSDCPIPYGGTDTGWVWTKEDPESGNRMEGVALDSNGNAFITGFGSQGIMIESLNECGAVRWAKSYPGTWTWGKDIAVATDGNVYITGYIEGDDVDMDPGPGVDIYTSTGTHDVFLMSLTSAGSYRWTLTWGAAGWNYGNSIDTDASGNIYVAGEMYGSDVDMDPGPGEDIHSIGMNGAFVSKFDSSGNFQWSRTWSGPSILADESAQGVAVTDSGVVYVTGWFRESVDFDPDPVGEDIHVASTYTDVFLVCLDTNGVYNWAQTWGGGQWDRGYDVAVDSAGNPHVSGQFGSTVDFNPDPDPLQEDWHTANDSQDIFVVKLSSAGVYQWGRTWGGDTSQIHDLPYGIEVDASGNVYVTGYYTGDNVEFNTDPILEDLHNGLQDVFLSKFDSGGGYLWARVFGAPGKDIGHGIALSDTGNIYIAGLYSNTVEFAPIGPPCNANSDVRDLPMGSTNSFVIKYLPNGCW